MQGIENFIISLSMKIFKIKMIYDSLKLYDMT